MSDPLASAFAAIVARRRSVRGFTSEPVPPPLLRRIFELAARAPSNCNTQPWQVYVASGAACERLRQRLPAALAAGDYQMDFDYSGSYAGPYKERQRDAAARLYAAMGIERADKAARAAAFDRNFRFFGAPHVAFLFLPETFGLREAADVGMFADSLMLAMAAFGVASCPQTALSFNARVVREALQVDASNKLLFGISFGYEDPAESANACRVDRAPLAENIHFVD